MNAREFACSHLEKLRAEQNRLDHSAFGLSRGFSLRQRVALASWLCSDRPATDDLTPDLDAIISGQLMIPGDVVPNVVRDEARKMLKAWQAHQTAAATENEADSELERPSGV